MAKISKSQFKQLVKECLIEILTEGLGKQDFNVAELTSESRRQEVSANQRQTQQQSPQQRAAANVKFAPTQAVKSAAAIQDAKKLANGDPVMESIFADTAATHQDFPMDQVSDTPGPQLNVEHFQGDPLEIFGESASHWAQILSKLG